MSTAVVRLPKMRMLEHFQKVGYALFFKTHEYVVLPGVPKAAEQIFNLDLVDAIEA